MFSKPDSSPTNIQLTPYVQRILERRHPDKWVSAILSLENDQLPIETKERLLELWELPKSYANTFSNFQYFTSEIQPRSKSLYQLMQTKDALPDTPISELRKSLSAIYDADTLNIFMQELSLIVAFHQVIIERPTKKELSGAAKVTIKELKKHLSALANTLSRIRGKQEWFYIQDAIAEAYQEAMEAQGFEARPSRRARTFFSDAEWMHLACESLSNADQVLFSDYSARGRREENRNKALVVLASSYELCFGSCPTSSDRRPKPCFYLCAYCLLELIGEVDGEREEDGLNDETVQKLVKSTVRTYKKIQENRIKSWIGTTFAEISTKKRLLVPPI